jgi:hypothetical protein
LLGKRCIELTLPKCKLAHLDTSDNHQKILNAIANINLPEKAELPLISQELISIWKKPLEQKEKQKIFMDMLKEAEKYWKSRKNMKREDKVKLFNDFIRIQKYEVNNRIKCVSQFPLLRPVSMEPISLNGKFLEVVSEEHNSTVNAWMQAINDSKVRPERFMTEDTEALVRKVLAVEDTKLLDKKLYRRVEVKLQGKDEEILAQKGINTKQYKRKRARSLLVSSINYQDLGSFKEDTRPISKSSDTSDIFRFCNSEFLFEDSIVRAECKARDSLISQAHATANKDKEIYNKDGVRSSKSNFATSADNSIQDWNNYKSTNCFVTLDIIDYIVQEVNLSRHQNCHPNQMILKILTKYPIALLIKPTTAKNHIFFSIAVEYSKFEQLFPDTKAVKTMFRSGDYLITEFVSLDYNKISNLLGLQHKMFSTMTLFHRTHTNMCNTSLMSMIKPIIFDDSVKNARAYFCTYLLCKLEDKDHTSSDMLNARHMYTECMTNDPYMNPGKTLIKMSDFPRSLLQVYFYQRLREVMLTHIANTPRITVQAEDNKDGTEVITNLFSWVTGREINTMSEFGNLISFGVFHNKDEVEMNSANRKMLTKIIKQEKLMYNEHKKDFGLNSKTIEELRETSHGFSLNFAKLLGDTIKQNLEKKHTDLESYLTNVVLEKMSRINLIDKATMKASASKFTDYGPYEFERREKNSNRRKGGKKGIKISKHEETSKCIIEVMELLSYQSFGGPNFMCFIDMLIRDKEKSTPSGGITAYLFNKLQLQGVREIFVLTFLDRLIVNFVETLSREICADFENEMQTHPKDKLARVRHHYNLVDKAQQERAGGTIHCLNSDDASTWCQRFVMSFFGCVFSRFLSGPLLNVVCRVFNMCTLKRLLVPQDLLRTFRKNPNMLTACDDAINTLSRQFRYGKRENEQLIIDQGNTFMRNTSNFMQGIFHYTSSLIHAGYCFVIHYVSTLLVEIMNKNYSLRFELISTSMVSSDDSWLASSLTGVLDEDINDGLFLVMVMGAMKEVSYPLMCARCSWEKSILSMSALSEFNSTFTLNGSVSSMPLKFVEAATRVPSQCRLSDRQHTWSTMLSQVVENSGDVGLAARVQLAQAAMHYEVLGASVNPLFEKFADVIKTKPHETSGFFLLEPELTSGLLGLDYASYIAFHSDLNYRKMHHHLYFGQQDLEMDTAGRIRSKVYIPHGEHVRLSQFRSRIGYDPQILDDMAENSPQSFLLEPNNESTLRAHVYNKVSDPSIGDSFQQRKDSEAFTESVYMLSKPWLLLSGKDEILGNETEDESKKTKISLFKYVNDIKCKNANWRNFYEPSKIDHIYPFKWVYSELTVRLSMLSEDLNKTI